MENRFQLKKTLRRGVPQGSVLGPILFCIYNIELSHLKNHGVNFKLFADDTQFYMSVCNVQDTELVLNNIMSDIGKWMESKQLKLNENKTECIIVGKRCDLGRIHVPQLCINGVDMEVSDTVKDLGVILDCNLTFKNQINQTVRTIIL